MNSYHARCERELKEFWIRRILDAPAHGAERRRRMAMAMSALGLCRSSVYRLLAAYRRGGSAVSRQTRREAVKARHDRGPLPMPGCVCPACHGEREARSRVSALDDRNAMQPLVPGTE